MLDFLIAALFISAVLAAAVLSTSWSFTAAFAMAVLAFIMGYRFGRL